MIEGRAWAKVRDWLARYGVAECAGITCALVASGLVRHVTRNPIAAGYAAAWGETVGYSAAIVARDTFPEVRAARQASTASRLGRIGRLLAGWGMEFGPAGVLDTLVTRPVCMAFGMRLFGPIRGLVFGKLAADIVFYVPVIFSYERRKHARLQS